MKKIYKCIENICNNIVSGKNRRCNSCHIKLNWKNGEYNHIKKPYQLGKDNPNYKKGIYAGIHYCIDGCSKKVSRGGNRCKGCARKFEIKNNLRIMPSYKGRKHTDEVRELIRKAHKGRIFTEEHKDNIKKNHKNVYGKSNPMYGKKREDLSLRNKSNINKTYEQIYGNIKSQIIKNKLRKSFLLLWKNPIIKEKLHKHLNELLKRKGKNKSEQRLESILNTLYPTEYKFVGDGKIWIGHFNPDFINVNGQKKIIELFGDYWHNREDTKERDIRKLKTYNEYGYKTLVIWQNELKKEGNEIINKLNSFHQL